VAGCHDSKEREEKKSGGELESGWAPYKVKERGEGLGRKKFRGKSDARVSGSFSEHSAPNSLIPFLEGH